MYYIHYKFLDSCPDVLINTLLAIASEYIGVNLMSIPYIQPEEKLPRVRASGRLFIHGLDILQPIFRVYVPGKLYL